MRRARGPRALLAVALSMIGCSAFIDFDDIEPYPDGGSNRGSGDSGSNADARTVRGAAMGGTSTVRGGMTRAGGRNSEGGSFVGGASASPDAGKAMSGSASDDGGKTGAGDGGDTSGGGATPMAGRRPYSALLVET